MEISDTFKERSLEKRQHFSRKLIKTAKNEKFSEIDEDRYQKFLQCRMQQRSRLVSDKVCFYT